MSTSVHTVLLPYIKDYLSFITRCFLTFTLSVNAPLNLLECYSCTFLHGDMLWIYLLGRQEL